MRGCDQGLGLVSLWQVQDVKVGQHRIRSISPVSPRLPCLVCPSSSSRCCSSPQWLSPSLSPQWCPPSFSLSPRLHLSTPTSFINLLLTLLTSTTNLRTNLPPPPCPDNSNSCNSTCTSSNTSRGSSCLRSCYWVCARVGEEEVWDTWFISLPLPISIPG